MPQIQEISDSVERYTLRKWAAEFCEEESIKRGLISYAPPKERIAVGLSDREIPLLLAVAVSPSRFATDIDSYRKECELAGEKMDIPERCISPVVPYRFDEVDAVLQQTKAYQELTFRFSKQFDTLKKRRRKHLTNKEISLAQLDEEWEEFFRGYHRAIQDFLHSQTLPPVSHEATLIWQDWTSLNKSLITPTLLYAGRQLLAKKTSSAIAQILKSPTPTLPFEMGGEELDLDEAIYMNKREEIDKWFGEKCIPALDLDDVSTRFIEELLREPSNKCSLEDMKFALDLEDKFTYGAAHGIQDKLHRFFRKERYPIKVRIRNNKELGTYTIELQKVDKSEWLCALGR
tara:strand:+ start:1050 stop:2087 length:1038 start_codon:yes stop_codon:yes gene_type:complete